MIFKNFRKIFGYLRKCQKSSEIFGKLRKRFKINFQMFLWLFKVFGKSSEVFGSVRKSSEMIVGCDRKCSWWFAGVERFWRSLFGSPQMDPSKLLRARNDGKVEWNTTRCILPVAYRRICNGNPGLWLAVFFKTWDKKQNYTTLHYTTLQYIIYNTI